MMKDTSTVSYYSMELLFLVEKDIPRTNNVVEGWHNCFNSLLNSVQPSIWIFINALKKKII